VKQGDKVAAITQYLYLPSNRSDLLNLWGLSPSLGRLMGVFTTWPANYIEFLVASAKPEHRRNLLKYFATALLGTLILASMGIKGWEYFGYTSPLQLLKVVRGEFPIAGIAERPSVIVIKQLRRVLDGDRELKSLFFKTFEEE